MGLIKTEEYLHHTLISVGPKTFDFNMYNVIFVPPKNNIKANKISIYSYDIYNPSYEIYIAQDPIYISSVLLLNNQSYKITADEDVQMYYEKKEDKTV